MSSSDDRAERLRASRLREGTSSLVAKVWERANEHPESFTRSAAHMLGDVTDYLEKRGSDGSV